ncbi:hypothetical protein M5689_011549 [Euphorbia peplus]|nr:hypothetical protein M5689_011549 [Euphorbia peplus]
MKKVIGIVVLVTCLIQGLSALESIDQLAHPLISRWMMPQPRLQIDDDPAEAMESELVNRCMRGLGIERGCSDEIIIGKLKKKEMNISSECCIGLSEAYQCLVHHAFLNIPNSLNLFVNSFYQYCSTTLVDF